MKKRIIAMILIVVMSVLALASCGSSVADDLAGSATFSDAQKAAFEKILKELVIEDGTFGSAENAEQREAKVWDSIYATLKSEVDTKDESLRLTTGAIGDRDLIYYAYYCTAEIEVGEGDDKTVETKYFYTANMGNSDVTKYSNMQLGVWGEKTDDYLARKFNELFANVTLGTEDGQHKAYTAIFDSTQTVSEGDVVYVTYSFRYTLETTNDKGELAELVKTGTVTNAAMVVGAAVAEGETAQSLASYLNGKKIATTLTNTTINEEGKGDVEYSNIKINWKSEGDELGSFKHETFKNSSNEKVEVTDINGDKYDLKNEELTYHVYPVYFYEVPEYNAEAVMNYILGKNISEANLITILFGPDFTGLHVDHDGHDHDDDDFTDEQKENMEKLPGLLAKYSFVDGDETLDLEGIAEKIADLQSKFDTAESKLKTEKSDLEKAQDAYDEAKKAVDDAGDNVTEAQEATLKTKETALNTAKEDLLKAQKDYDEAKKNRDKKVELFLKHTAADGTEEGGIKDELTVGYMRAVYSSLQTTYNTTIKNNLVAEVLYFLYKNVTVNGAPEKLVDETYDQLFQNYQYEFYKQDSSTSGLSNYKKYNGDFKAFLVAEVTTDIKKVSNYDEAVAAIREKAEKYLEPVTAIFAVAKAYGEFVDDDAFKAYQDDVEGDYAYNEYTYGENGARYIHQFDKLMDYFLESEEDKGEADENGIVIITDKYERLQFTIGDKSGSALDKEAAEEE